METVAEDGTGSRAAAAGAAPPSQGSAVAEVRPSGTAGGSWPAGGGGALRGADELTRA
ncbi:hypothetical protein MNEG_15390, partial [Monoraphidium neglectum]